MHSIKIIKTGESQPLYICQVSCIKAANGLLSIIILSKRVQYQGKAGFLRLNFQNNIFQNSHKCKLGLFLLRQSHILPPHVLWCVYCCFIIILLCYTLCITTFFVLWALSLCANGTIASNIVCCVLPHVLCHGHCCFIYYKFVVGTVSLFHGHCYFIYFML